MRYDPDGKGVALISIVSPVEAWTEHLSNSRLGTLLHEMAHAVFRASLAARCDSCYCKVNLALSRGLPNHGHGRSWKQLAQAVEEEANPRLLGLRVVGG